MNVSHIYLNFCLFFLSLFLLGLAIWADGIYICSQTSWSQCEKKTFRWQRCMFCSFRSAPDRKIDFYFIFFLNDSYKPRYISLIEKVTLKHSIYVFVRGISHELLNVQGIISLNNAQYNQFEEKPVTFQMKKNHPTSQYDWFNIDIVIIC